MGSQHRGQDLEGQSAAGRKISIETTESIQGSEPVDHHLKEIRMKLISVRLSRDLYVGTSDDHWRLQEDTIFIIGANDLAAATVLAIENLGEMASQSFSFAGQVLRIADAVNQREDRTRGILDTEESQLTMLLKAVQRDLGSIEIVRVIFNLSVEGKVVTAARIEATEGARTRVILLPNQGGPIDSIAPRAVTAAIEAKF